jgi:hypothetical protein
MKRHEQTTTVQPTNEDLETAKALEAKIEKLKKTHARPDATGKKIPLTEIFVLKVGDKTAFLRKPDRHVASLARTVGQGDYIKIQEAILDAVWLEGDEEIRNDYFLNAIPFLENLIQVKTVELKKS